MTIKLNGALGRCLAGSVLGALMAVAFVPTAVAQWMPPWGARVSRRDRTEVSRRKDMF